MKKTTNLISLAQSMTYKYGEPELESEEDIDLQPIIKRDDSAIAKFHQALIDLGDVHNNLTRTSMGKDEKFGDEFYKAIEILTKLFYKARDISRLGPNYENTP